MDIKPDYESHLEDTGLHYAEFGLVSVRCWDVGSVIIRISGTTTGDIDYMMKLGTDLQSAAMWAKYIMNGV